MMHLAPLRRLVLSTFVSLETMLLRPLSSTIPSSFPAFFGSLFASFLFRNCEVCPADVVTALMRPAFRCAFSNSVDPESSYFHRAFPFSLLLVSRP